MNCWRIACGVALSRSPESRWRQISVTLSSFVFTVLLLGAAAVLAMHRAEDSRAAGQVAVLSSSPAPSDVLVLRSDDQWRGSTIQVVNMDPGTGSPLPPGLQSWPSPGQSVVSPALSRLMAAHPNLSRRYPRHGVMTAEGIRAGGDLLVYQVVGPGVLPDDGTVLRVANGHWAGTGPVVRVAAFGASEPGLPRIGLAPPATGSRGEISTGLLLGLILPGLVVLAVGLSAGSAMRTHRFDVLHALGVPSAMQRRVGTAETMILAIPGALAGTIAWALAGRWLEEVPVVGRRVVRGDLALPWWALLGCLTLALAVAALIATTSTALRRMRTTSPRPTGGRPLSSRLALIPAYVAVAAFAAGKVVGGDREADLVLVGTAAAIIGTPLMMPAVVRAAGGVLAAASSPARALVGHGMVWDPAGAGRPFVGLGAALVMMLAGTGFLALAEFTEPPVGLERGPQAVAVQWRGAGPDALSSYAARLGALVVPYASPEGAGGPQSQATLGAACPQLSRLVGGACQPSAPYLLSAEVEQKLVRMLDTLGVSEAPLTDVKLVPPGEMAVPADATEGRALVLAARPLPVLDEQVRNVAMSSLPSAKVTSLLQSVQSPSPLVPWIKGALVAALSALALACLLSLIDRLQAVRRQHHQLLRMGASSHDMAALGRWLFCAPYTVVCVASGTAGVLICGLIVRPILPLPWSTIGVVLLFMLGCGVLGAMATGLAGTRAIPETRD